MDLQPNPGTASDEESRLLERALSIAVEAHAGQRDKAGGPYILHPIRVMCHVQTMLEKTVAILHDMVEDCPGWTFERLASEGFGSDVLEPLRLVTKLDHEDTSTSEGYFAFVRRCAEHPVARAVKRADIEDNLDLSRIANPTEKDFQRLEKYREAIVLLAD